MPTTTHTLSVTVTGHTFTRTTKHDYTHVVISEFDDGTVNAEQWSKTRINAEKGAKRIRDLV